MYVVFFIRDLVSHPHEIIVKIDILQVFALFWNIQRVTVICN